MVRRRTFLPFVGVIGVARSCCDSIRGKVYCGSGQRPAFTVFGPVAVDIAAQLMHAWGQKAERTGRCVRVWIAHPKGTAYMASLRLWLCQVENEAFNE